MRYYDTRLLAYIGLVAAPLEAVIIKNYKKNPRKKAAYIEAALVGQGSAIGSILLGKLVYEAFHNEFVPKNKALFKETYLTKYLYDKASANLSKDSSIPSFEEQERLAVFRDTSNRYSVNLLNAVYFYTGASLLYRGFVGYKLFDSIPKALAYSVFVPNSIALEDAEYLKTEDV